MSLSRRGLLATAALGATALTAPAIVQAQASRELRFIPHADPTSLDPVWTTADITRNHGNLVYDQLYGVDENFKPHPQMVAGATTSADGLTWELTLRDGLTFHDGAPVLAKDCVATIKRWWVRDSYGTVLQSLTNEITAPSDKVIRIRLKKPFALLPEALAQPACVIMPERIAATSPNVQITDPVGSGPFRFKTDERVSGSRVVYERNAAYVPRPDGQTSFLAGPKVVHFDRVIWTVQPDPATAAAAMQKNEFDWYEAAAIDLVSLLRRDRNLSLRIINRMGGIGCIRFNHLHPPFNNVAIRRLVQACVNQRDFAEAVAGAEPELIKTGVGLFTPGMPMATDAGVEAMAGRTDFDNVKRELVAAGYKGEKVVLLGPSTIPSLHAQSLVTNDLLGRMGFNVDYQALEWGTVVQRRASKEPNDKGGWNIFITNLTSLTNVFVPAQFAIRSGPAAWFGWPDAPKLEELRDQWLVAPNEAEQKRIVRELQLQSFRDVPYVPTGQWVGYTCFNNSLTGIQNGWPVFWSVRKA
ncbi:MAG: ABC transporter substrate-binding protein [Acetobacteraceae bacterium]|nr:ABC transporter substrate-binding protein [Acetobacteraceae bacterium]